MEKAVEVSLFSWLRKLLNLGPKPRREPRPRSEQTTIEYDAHERRLDHAVPEGASGEQPSGPFHLRFGAVSVVGPVREHNEDSYYVPPEGSGLLLFVVADGMGGQQAGEQASSMAVKDIPRELRNRMALEAPDDEKLTVRAIRDAVAHANQEILSLASVETEFSNMGTTVVLALFQRDNVYVSGIGDSPAYRLRDGRLEQLTRDHSLAKALEEAGTITSEEVPTHKFKNVLYLYLGSKDARGGPEDVRVMDLKGGDRFLLATDGLTGVVSDERLAEALRTSTDPPKTAQALVSEALANNSKDNITSVVIHVEGA
jgi:PPM family protein phosphatase